MMIRLKALLFLLLALFALTTVSLPAHAARTAKKPSPVENRIAAPAQVMELKHWSNPDYTRIAIALERDVTWESHELDRTAGRSGKPGRIFIDLHNTRLASTIREITIGDGLLKGVRAGLYKPGVVRVVLDRKSVV